MAASLERARLLDGLHRERSLGSTSYVASTRLRHFGTASGNAERRATRCQCTWDEQVEAIALATKSNCARGAQFRLVASCLGSPNSVVSPPWPRGAAAASTDT